MRSILVQVWEGPPDLSRALRLEWRFVVIRWLGICCAVPGLLLAELSPGRLIGAYVLLAIAAAYNVAIHELLRRRPSFVARGIFTTTGDALLNIAMLTIAGFNSPFYYILYTITIAAAMRYGYVVALCQALFFVVADFGESVLDASPLGASFVVRSGFLVLTALLASYLHEQAEGAERALQERIRDLEAAHEELLRVAEMKTNFLANVSHEFRTPLSSIRSFSELLLSYDDPTVQRDFLEIINLESERLTRMVNDVLDITKIESGNMSWEMSTLDVERLAREIERAYVPLMDQHNLSFTADISPNLPPVYGDWDRLRQVLGNLLDNAVKFTHRGGVRLVAYPLGDEVRIAVADTGVGVSPKDQERIFEKFQQVGEVLTDKPRGAGLGLSICREIVEHHQGRIWVESEPGQGSTFIVALRAVTRPPSESSNSWTAPSLVTSH